MNKNERNTIYKEALFQYRFALHKDIYIGICAALFKALQHLGEVNGKPDPFDFIEEYPEIAKYKPERNCLFWFPVYETEMRIKILEEAIQATE